MTVLAISGGKWSSIRTSDGNAIGISLPCGTNRTVEVTLSFMDTYTVRRYRHIVRGERRGDDIVEYEAQDVYCDQIAEVAYQPTGHKPQNHKYPVPIQVRGIYVSH